MSRPPQHKKKTRKPKKEWRPIKKRGRWAKIETLPSKEGGVTVPALRKKKEKEKNLFPRGNEKVQLG